MCSSCGCGDDGGARVTLLGAEPEHNHHEHHHRHPHENHAKRDPQTLVIEQQILAKNDLLAESNRRWLAERGITALNLMSSPGSGKTTLLARTISELSRGGEGPRISVIEGDQETHLDAERIRATGAAVVQINTGAGCHLDSDMLRRGLDTLDPQPGSLLFVENVGNLVCPALFDLGESARVVVASVTEGADKPLKYPAMFAAADLVVVNKSDLLPYVDFDLGAFVGHARQVRHDVECVVVSAKSGEGLDGWYHWLEHLNTGEKPRSPRALQRPEQPVYRSERHD